MKKRAILSATIMSLLLSASAYSAQKAITEEGDVVILNTDGTWRFEEPKLNQSTEIAVNSEKFVKPKDATFALKSKKTDAVVWFNPKDWTFKKNNNGHDVAEYTFNNKDLDLYGMVISEQFEIQVEQLADIAVENARSAATDVEVIKKEYREVNGKKVIYMEMEGTIQSIKFTYLGYYYSDESGSTQLLAYTGANLVAKYRKDIEAFLNGFNTREDRS